MKKIIERGKSLESRQIEQDKIIRDLHERLENKLESNEEIVRLKNEIVDARRDAEFIRQRLKEAREEQKINPANKWQEKFDHHQVLLMQAKQTIADLEDNLDAAIQENKRLTIEIHTHKNRLSQLDHEVSILKKRDAMLTMQLQEKKAEVESERQRARSRLDFLYAQAHPYLQGKSLELAPEDYKHYGYDIHPEYSNQPSTKRAKRE